MTPDCSVCLIRELMNLLEFLSWRFMFTGSRRGRSIGLLPARAGASSLLWEQHCPIGWLNAALTASARTQTSLRFRLKSLIDFANCPWVTAWI